MISKPVESSRQRMPRPATSSRAIEGEEDNVVDSWRVKVENMIHQHTNIVEDWDDVDRPEIGCNRG